MYKILNVYDKKKNDKEANCQKLEHYYSLWIKFNPFDFISN